MTKVIIEFTTEYQFNTGTWFVPGSRVVMKGNVADWYTRRGLAKIVTGRKRKESKNGGRLDGRQDGSTDGSTSDAGTGETKS